jgi:hypothetical protein
MVDDFNDNATSMPRLLFPSDGFARVCASADPNKPGIVSFSVAPRNVIHGCDGVAGDLKPFFAGMYSGVDKDNRKVFVTTGCPSVVEDPQTFPANSSYLIRYTDLCTADSLRNAHRLFCLIETGNDTVGKSGCESPRIGRDEAQIANVWTAPTPLPATPAPPRPAKAIRDLEATPPAPVYIPWCVVETRAEQGRWTASVTAHINAFARDIRAVQMQVTPLDYFGANIDGDYAQTVVFDTPNWGDPVGPRNGSDLRWMNLINHGVPRDAETNRLRWYRLRLSAVLPYAWLIKPGALKCQPVGVEYKDQPPWRKQPPKQPPTRKPH